MNGESARLFLALWPDEPIRQHLMAEARRLHRQLGGRMTRPESVHLTLVFIGSLLRERLAELIEGIGAVRAPAFEVVFDEADCWQRNHIAFIGATAPPQPLLDLVGGLEGCLQELAIPFDRRPYKAHITLLRHAQCKKQTPIRDRGSSQGAELGEFEPIRWSVRDFVLVESCPTADGIVYEVRARVPL